jgi:hypothetical protein
VRNLKLPLSLLLGALLAGCALFGQLPLQPFDARLEQAYTSNTNIRDLSTTALNAKAISSEKAENIKNLNDETRRTLDLAKDGDERGLDLAEEILRSLDKNLDKALKESGNE